MSLGSLLNPIEAAKLVALAPSTLSEYRREKLLVEGLHYVRYTGRSYRYFGDALYHWATHRQQPEEHHAWLLAKQREADRCKVS
jgi:hypothetical protein